MSNPDLPAAANFLESVGKLFRYYKELGEGAMAQLSDADLHLLPAPFANSIAIIVKHLWGNMLSRWTDFLSSDGEKPWREREAEFTGTLTTRSEIMHAWEEGWERLFQAIDPLTEEDVNRIIYIRNEGHTVLEALNRQLAHYAYHVGQIVFMAKQIKGKDFQSLSIPRGGTEAYNAKKFKEDKGRRHFV
jgi:uncharacterized damage-inducible protein DinB